MSLPILRRLVFSVIPTGQLSEANQPNDCISWAQQSTRFYEDEYSPETRKFISDFTEAYGVKPIEQVPSQALLGYDSARYLLTNLKANKGVFTPEESAAFKGLQSTFMFVTADEEVANDDIRTTGPVNQALYIIKFLPGEQVSVQVL